MLKEKLKLCSSFRQSEPGGNIIFDMSQPRSSMSKILLANEAEIDIYLYASSQRWDYVEVLFSYQDDY